MENEWETKRKLPEGNKKEREEQHEKLKIFKKQKKEVNDDQALNVTVDDEDGEELCVSFPNSENAESSQGQV